MWNITDVAHGLLTNCFYNDCIKFKWWKITKKTYRPGTAGYPACSCWTRDRQQRVHGTYSLNGLYSAVWFSSKEKSYINEFQRKTKTVLCHLIVLNTLVNRLLNCLISLFGPIFSHVRITFKGPSINPIIFKRPLKFLTNFYNDKLMQINGTTRRNLKPGLKTNGQILLSPKQRWSAFCNKKTITGSFKLHKLEQRL